MSNILFIVWPCHKIYHLPSAIGGVKGMDWVRKVMRKIPRCIDIYCHSIFGFEILFCILFAERILKCMCWKKCINPDFPAKMHWIVGNAKMNASIRDQSRIGTFIPVFSQMKHENSKMLEIMVLEKLLVSLNQIFQSWV